MLIFYWNRNYTKQAMHQLFCFIVATKFYVLLPTTLPMQMYESNIPNIFKMNNFLPIFIKFIKFKKISIVRSYWNIKLKLFSENQKSIFQVVKNYPFLISYYSTNIFNHPENCLFWNSNKQINKNSNMFGDKAVFHLHLFFDDIEVRSLMFIGLVEWITLNSLLLLKVPVPHFGLGKICQFDILFCNNNQKNEEKLSVDWRIHEIPKVFYSEISNIKTQS